MIQRDSRRFATTGRITSRLRDLLSHSGFTRSGSTCLSERSFPALSGDLRRQWIRSLGGRLFVRSTGPRSQKSKNLEGYDLRVMKTKTDDRPRTAGAGSQNMIHTI